jgi:rhamnose utilization protein RhaD (predicted bifunctional aldolase and dehydrogenase)
MVATRQNVRYAGRVPSDTAANNHPQFKETNGMARAEEILEQLTKLSNYLGDPQRDYAILGEGNTSGRADEDLFFVKASGKHLGNIDPAGFCGVHFSRVLPALDRSDVDDAGVKDILTSCRVDGTSKLMPSVETFLHAYLLTLPGVNYVGHTHPTAVNSILCSVNARQAISGRLFPDEIVCCGVAPCYVEYTDPGVTLAKLLRRRVQEYGEKYGQAPRVILMQNHGLIGLGNTPRDVMSATDMYVKVARVIIGTYALGGPNFFPEEHVRRIHTRPDELYRIKEIGGRAD